MIFFLSAVEFLRTGSTLETLRNAAASAAVTATALTAIQQFYSLTRKYNGHMTDIANLQTDLNELGNAIQERYPMLENLTEKMGNLNVV